MTMTMIMHNLPGCQYCSIWQRELARQGWQFINDSSYIDVAPGSHVSIQSAVAKASAGKATIVLYWRWPMPNDSAKQSVYLSQQYLLATVPKSNLVILDGDHKVPKAVQETHKIVSPQLSGDGPMYPHFAHLETDVRPKARSYVTYIGTPLDRVDQVNLLFAKTPCKLWGSWGQEKLPSTCEVMGKLDNKLVLRELSGAVTVLLAKQSYYEQGYITPRWNEAAYAGCAVMIPEQYKKWLPDYLHKWLVSDASEVHSLLHRLKSSSNFKANVVDLRSFCKSLASPDRWNDLSI